MINSKLEINIVSNDSHLNKKLSKDEMIEVLSNTGIDFLDELMIKNSKNQLTLEIVLISGQHIKLKNIFNFTKELEEQIKQDNIDLFPSILSVFINRLCTIIQPRTILLTESIVCFQNEIVFSAVFSSIFNSKLCLEGLFPFPNDDEEETLCYISESNATDFKCFFKAKRSSKSINYISLKEPKIPNESMENLVIKLSDFLLSQNTNCTNTSYKYLE
jgi:hypothetical protein